MVREGSGLWGGGAGVGCVGLVRSNGACWKTVEERIPGSGIEFIDIDTVLSELLVL
jgi:hypothetical protein